MNINHSSAIIKPSPLTPIGTAKPRAISQAALAHADISDTSREKLASYVGYQQQQALVQTAQNAYSQKQEPEAPVVTGEIAKNAAAKQTQQALTFMAINALTEKSAERPHIQTKA